MPPVAALRSRDDRSRAGPRATIVERAADELALRIATGTYAPGSMLPSVRKLAGELGINASTIQVVIARLDAAGFVDPQHGRGVQVRDVRLVGGIETWRYLFRFSSVLRDLAADMLRDILTTRRNIACDAMRAIAEAPRLQDSSTVRHAVQRFEFLLDQRAAPGVLGPAEMAAFRQLLLASRQGLALAVFNSVGELLLDIPSVIDTMYEDAALHLAAWQALLSAWDRASLTDAVIDRVDSIMAERDRKLVERLYPTG